MLVGSALIARRVKFSAMLRYILVWIAIFMAAYGLFLFRDDLASVWARARADLGGAPEASVSGSEVIIRRDPDGHFWVNASVNGLATRFLIDSGATTTSVSREFAERVKLNVDNDGYPVLVDTANGEAVMRRGKIDQLVVGSIVVEGHHVLVGDAIGDVGVLGMNFLSGLKSWRVEGASLTLTP
ncbi:retropepsin-like aspartic protease family protein [Flavisphingopyxis soli]|uniref:retropepsin-like aspartic protease family protein n=1 Tax=Flavisphingopyxis soli TaxID=2601267 RepID=UPI001375D031|nr:TIGR02281 family clan AA aspartic protease [Sphingorhabdus soli]